MGGNWSLTAWESLICNRVCSLLTIAPACLKHTLDLQVLILVVKFPQVSCYHFCLQENVHLLGFFESLMLYTAEFGLCIAVSTNSEVKLWMKKF
jgi:hypothetical protein